MLVPLFVPINIILLPLLVIVFLLLVPGGIFFLPWVVLGWYYLIPLGSPLWYPQPNSYYFSMIYIFILS